MKVIGINGSPRKDGNTAKALEIMGEELKKEGIELEVIQVGHLNLHGCIGCNYCTGSKDNTCVFKDDELNDIAMKIRNADGFILGSPTYYAGIAGNMKSFLDRLFYTSMGYFKYKVATSVSVARRAGGVDVVHQLNNYLNLAQTVMVPSQYWTSAYGLEKDEILEDLEGVQTIKKNAQSMAWLLKLIEYGKEDLPHPKDDDHIFTNFIR